MTRRISASAAALVFALTAPNFALAEDIAFDENPMIEAGADSNDGANNISINNERTYILSDDDGGCSDQGRTVILSQVETTNINIGTDGVVEVDDGDCISPIEHTAIRVEGIDGLVGSTGTVTVNGRVSVSSLTASTAIDIAQSMGDTTITIGNNGQVDGIISIGQGGDHELVNNGTINGRVLFAESGEAPSASQVLENNGTINADGTNAVEVGNSTYTETILDADEDPQDEDDLDTTTLSRDYQVIVANNDTINGNVYLGASGAHGFQNRGVDDDLEDTVMGGMNGTVIFGGGPTSPYESVGGTYQNFGTHVAGDDGIAVMVEAERDPDEVLGGYDEELNRHTIEGVNITNAFGGSIFGSILVEGDDSHGFTNQGTLVGRVMFDGLGQNLVTLSGGGIYRDDDDATTAALVHTGGGRDRVILSGTILSPNEIVELEEGEEAAETVDMTLIDLGAGDDFATLSSGGLLGATIALDGGAGDDHITITPNGTTALAIEGTITGGAGDNDTLEINGGSTGIITEITGAQDYQDFENFSVTSGEVHLNITDAVAAAPATDDMEAVEAVDETMFGVSGGNLSISEGATLRLGMMGSLSDGADYIRHFNLMTGTNEGTLVFDTKTELHNADAMASFTNAASGTLGFVVVTDTDEETGISTVDSFGQFYDSSTDDSFDRLVLESGSSIGLVLNNLTLATELDEDSDFFRDALGVDEERDIFSELKFDVVYTPAGIVRTITPGAEEGDPDTIVDVDIADGFNLEGAGINMIRENPFYAFAFDVDGTGDQTIISIIASRKPAMAFSLRSMGQDVGAGKVLDQIFEDTLGYDCDSPLNDAQEASCAIDGAVRNLARAGFGSYAAGVRAFEPNRHSGLWQGMLSNQEMTLGTVSLRSATVRADAGGLAPTQYAALPTYSTAANPLAKADEQQAGISGVNAGNIWEANRFWLQGFGSIGDRESSSTDVGHQSTNGGVVFGYDRRLTRTQLLGFFGSYGIANVDSAGADGEELTINSYTGGLYYTRFSRTASAEFSLAGGGSNIEGDRLPLGGGTASYEANGWHVAARAAADTNMKAARFVITPNIALQYTFMNQGEYDETGTSPSLLSVDAINMHSLETTLGVNAGLPIRMGRLAALPKFKLAWAHEFLDETADVGASLINVPGTNFTAAAVEVPADRVTTGLGLDLASRGGTTFTLGYDFSLGSDYMAHGGAATFRFPF